MMLNKSFFLSAAMLLGTVLTFSLGCTASNEQFCAVDEDCGTAQACSGGVCQSRSETPVGGVEAAPDAAQAPVLCSSEDQLCVASAPTGWSGPAARVDQEPGTDPACPAAFAGGEVIGFTGLSAGGSCGCSCGDTTDFSCRDAQIQGRDGPTDFQSCFSECEAGACVAQTLSSGVCTAISSTVRSQEVLRLDEGVVTDAVCAAGTIINDLQEPVFEGQVALCVANVEAGNCPAGSSCSAAPPEPFQGGMCIFQEGEHACPDSIYSQRTLIFADFEDQRSCETCECESGDIGSACGSIEVFNDDSDCSGVPANTNGICSPMPTLISPRARFTRRETLSCTGTVDPPTSGTTFPVGATTVCCAP